MSICIKKTTTSALIMLKNYVMRILMLRDECRNEQQQRRRRVFRVSMKNLGQDEKCSEPLRREHPGNGSEKVSREWPGQEEINQGIYQLCNPSDICFPHL